MKPTMWMTAQEAEDEIKQREQRHPRSCPDCGTRCTNSWHRAAEATEQVWEHSDLWPCEHCAALDPHYLSRGKP